MKTWNHRLQETFKKKFKTVVEFSEHSGVPKDSIHKYLKEGVNQPRGNILELLAKSLDVDLLWLKEGIFSGEAAKGANPAMTKDAVVEILRQIRELYPDASEKTRELLVGKVYDELKDEPGIDPGYVRGFLRSKNLEKFL